MCRLSATSSMCASRANGPSATVYDFNEATDKSIDGRDLWSGRVTIGIKPIERLQIYTVWEHFQEDDDRARSTKQLCKKDPGLTSIDGFDVSGDPVAQAVTSQGCKPTSLYSADAFETPNGQSNPIVAVDEFVFNNGANGFLLNQVDPYASVAQPRSLRVIQSLIDPTYRAKNDTFELNADLRVAPDLTLTSQTGYNKDQLASTEDFNRFNTTPGLFNGLGAVDPTGFDPPPVTVNGVYCDPQVGCSDRMVGEDLSQARAWQFNQEVRLASNFSGPFNFSVGANYTHYQTLEDYYVFLNLITASEQHANRSGPGDYSHCYTGDRTVVPPTTPVYANVYEYSPGNPHPTIVLSPYPSNFGCDDSSGLFGTYIDPNPIDHLNGLGHNYFRSENPYRLNSLAGFGEAYYQVMPDVKLTAGLRWTDDSKRFWDIPSWVFLEGGGYPVLNVVNQEWREWTGRFNANWTPKLDFTDQTMFYASYARGYKGGGANPPGATGTIAFPSSLVTHPPTFAPEFVNAFEMGTKNTLFDGSMTLNADVFYYDYKGYQISQIVDRTSVNLNFNARVDGAEMEATWEPLPGLRFNFAGGLEDSSVNKGQSAIDLMDRTNGNTAWAVVKPSVVETSNCVLPLYVLKEMAQYIEGSNPGIFSGRYWFGIGGYNPCDAAYHPSEDYFGVYNLNTLYGITDFDPSTAPMAAPDLRRI